MRRRNEISTRPQINRSVAEKSVEWLIHLGNRRPIVRRLFQGLVKFSMIDIRYDVSGKVFVFVGVACIAISLLGVDGWITGKEAHVFFLGMLIIGMEMWLARKRHRTLLDLYGKWHGGITEWRNMVFDIRETYLNALHLTLENELPGVRIYGRHEDHSGHSKETKPTTHGHAQEWENRPGKYLRAICWVWKDGEKEVRLEYRRAPGNVYASRFFQTKGLTGSRHDYLRSVIDQEEWSCEPRFGWVCRLGVFKITAATAVAVTAILWGGRETAETVWKMDVTSSAIITYARWSFLEAGVVVLLVTVAVLARRHYFPAGVFRVDEEKDKQRDRERAQYKAMKWFTATLTAVVIAVGTPHLIDTCTRVDGESSVIRTYLKQSHLCRFIRSYTSLTEQLQTPTEKVD